MTVALVSFRATVNPSGSVNAIPQAAPVDSSKVLTAAAKTDATAADTAAAKGTTGGTNYDAAVTALGVLVADGATPTQAHVNTFKTSWDLLIVETAAAKTATATAKTSATAADTGVGTSQTSAGHAAVLTVDVTDIPTVSKLTAIFNELKRTAISSGLFTA